LSAGFALAPVAARAQTIEQLRERVANHALLIAPTMRGDLLDPKKTADNLIRAIDLVMQRHRIIIVMLHSDHHDDGNLGPYGYNPHGGVGWKAAFVPQNDDRLANEALTRDLILELLTQNPFVAKIGVPARYAARADLQHKAQEVGRVLFTEEGTAPHIAIQARWW
jgi:hypothetical protein